MAFLIISPYLIDSMVQKLQSIKATPLDPKDTRQAAALEKFEEAANNFQRDLKEFTDAIFED